MTKGSDHHSTDSEAGSVRSIRASKLGAILCPTVCALLLICIFTISFVGTKIAYDQYDAFCTARGFDGAKLYIFPVNMTVNVKAIQ